MTTPNEDTARMRARAVTAWDAVPVPLTAFQAARSMLGIIGIMTEAFGADGMRAACAELARCDAAWATQFRELPRDSNAQTLEPSRFLARAARGLLLTAGAANLRAAISFWATERDPAVFQQVAAGIAPA